MKSSWIFLGQVNDLLTSFPKVSTESFLKPLGLNKYISVNL